VRYPKGTHMDRDAMLLPHRAKKINSAARTIDKWLTLWPPLTMEDRVELAARLLNPENADR
jgi:hypothetical protein